jgi:hypothetical protein
MLLSPFSYNFLGNNIKLRNIKLNLADAKPLSYDIFKNSQKETLDSIEIDLIGNEFMKPRAGS